MSRKNNVALTAFSALAAAVAAYSLTRSQQVKIARLQDLEHHSTLIDTNQGPIETQIVGDGPNVVMAHGALGGYDRARLYSFPETGYRFICPSRPGYLRTPLWVGRTFEQQADAIAALLDALGIEKSAIVGCSAGGPVAIHFATRHPDRCWGLVLGNAITGQLSPWHGLMEPISRAVFDWDWLTWFGVNQLVLYLLRPNLYQHVRGNPEKLNQVVSMLATMYPTSIRRSGFVNDMEQIRSNQHYPLDQISIPTMVVHGTMDLVVPFTHGLRSADHIPGAKFLSIESGTHLDFISHADLIQPQIAAFLDAHKPQDGG